MRLGDVARLVRSKNAGPFMLTIDVMFADGAAYDRVAASRALTVERIESLYAVDASAVMVFPLRDALTVKISFPRDVPSGSPGDSDVYGCQYMWKLAALEIPEGRRHE
jgi:hypothetical protein